MLINLHVKNFAIIDEAEVDFKNHLNILTGETGAGKSILIGSIHTALGGKVSKEMIRNNAEFALVELLFESNDPKIIRLLEEHDIAIEENQILISRKIMAGGRNINKINGETVTAAFMKEAAAYLLDLHGQHEHQSLLHVKKHLEFVDRYAKEETEKIKEEIAILYSTYSKLKKELKASEMDQEKRLREISFLSYEIEEIEAAKLIKGEDDDLQAAYKRLSNASQIALGISEAYRYLSEDAASAEVFISRSIKAVVRISEFDVRISEFMEGLLHIETITNDLSREISEYIADMENSEEELDFTEKRLNTINHLKSKYGNSIPQILDSLSVKKDRLIILEDYDVYQNSIREQITETEQSLKKLSEKLSGVRKAKAKELIQNMTKALIELNFLDVRFDMIFSRLPEYTAEGFDAAEFIISTNPGEPLQPLDKIASGGELSRIMLALKSVLADKDEIETLIFDEIDAGISGRTAQKVSEKLAVISEKHQVLCITHLPQIAAMADAHYLIEKSSDGSSTMTQILPLNTKQSAKELARMLGGAEITEHVLQNAEEMKQLADAAKNKIRKNLK